MNLEVRVRQTGQLVTDVLAWDGPAMVQLANWARGAIIMRTQMGESAEGRSFEPYSTRSTYISYKSDTGKRLIPKGGRPSKTGRSRYYEGGYAQYKRESRKRDLVAGTAEVDLTLSGQMLRQVRVLRSTEHEAVVGIAGQSRRYAPAVDDDRPFMGLTPDEINQELDDEIKSAIDGAVRRLAGRSGGAVI